MSENHKHTASTGLTIEKRKLNMYEIDKYFNPTNVSFLRGHQRILYGNDKYILITRTEPGEKDSSRNTKMYYLESVINHDPGAESESNDTMTMTMKLKSTSGRPSNGFISEECSKFWILPSKREIHQNGDEWWIVSVSTM